MPVDIDIAHVAHLARLDLSSAELDAYRTQLTVILEHAARVQSIEVDEGDGNAHPLGLVNVFRDDSVRPVLDREEVLSQAPESRDGFFVAPPALESE